MAPRSRARGAPTDDVVEGTIACARCAHRTCACGEAVDDEHECSEDALATRQSIQRDAAPCVRCGAPSFRAEGCPTMWCPHCHTFWNWTPSARSRRWRTAAAQSRPPAVSARRARARRETDDAPADTGRHRDPPAFVRDATAYNAPLAPVIIDALEALHRARRLPCTRSRGTTRTSARRACPPCSATSPTRVERTLERLERTARFRRDVGRALEVLVLAGADVLQRLCGGADDLVAACVSLATLREVADARLETVGRLYARRVPRLRSTWVWA